MAVDQGHMCTGPGCWVCGEPDELRLMRQQQILPALHTAQQENPTANHHVLAKAAAQAIRPDVIRSLTAYGLLGDVLRLYDVTHKYAIQGGHDSLGENLTCSGCNLATQIRELLGRSA